MIAIESLQFGAARRELLDQAHRIATRAVGGTVGATTICDLADGTLRFAVSGESRGACWLGRHRFPELAHAEAGAVAVADLTGAEVRL